MSHERKVMQRKQVKHQPQSQQSQHNQARDHAPALQSVLQRAVSSAQALSPGEVMQMQRAMGNRALAQLMQRDGGGGGDESATAAGPRAGSGAGSHLPRSLQQSAEGLSGMSLEHVRVHYNSSTPKQFSAAAYAQGADIHLGPGEEQHLPHETWHVVQQAQGRVKPTRQMKGQSVNDEAGLEREADEMGAKLVQSSEKPQTSSSQTLQPQGGTSALGSVKQLARLENADPILANGRELLGDVDSLIIHGKRGSTTQDNLLDTTYDSIGENLLLDLNMLFEENLQRKIEHTSHFTDIIREVVKIIHESLSIESVDDELDTSKKIKEERINFVLRYIREKTGKEVTVDQLKQAGWSLEEVGKLDDQELKRKVLGYIKLLKMLETQYPYFGGSQEYHKNKTSSFEFWVYHLSTLTKDPDRQYGADSPKAGLIKPLIDYRTRSGGLVPHHNQRNLGTGIAEASWGELPHRLTQAMREAIRYVYGTGKEEMKGKPKEKSKSYRKALLEKLINKYEITKSKDDTNTDIVMRLWDIASEDDRKAIYGDIMMLPWSDAHRKLKDDNAPENVVGVMGNVLETPKSARKRYEKDLERYKEANDLQVIKHVDEPDEKLHTKKELLDDFEEKHEMWYQSAKNNYKPIIGGISGHTLGYLNLYEDALGKIKAEQPDNDMKAYPSMEELRANMLGALIGDKRHHSYDEVMTASHMIPTHVDQKELKYNHPESYKDVLGSGNDHIKNVAIAARDETIDSVKTPEGNTVLHMLKEKVYGKMSEEEGGNKFEALKTLIETEYIKQDFDRGQANIIKTTVNEAMTEDIRNLQQAPPPDVQEVMEKEGVASLSQRIKDYLEEDTRNLQQAPPPDVPKEIGGKSTSQRIKDYEELVKKHNGEA